MMTSHDFALSVLRTNPRRCAHQVYATVRPMSRAMSWAIRFSNPSPRSFEKGRLLGSEQTRRALGALGALGALRALRALREATTTPTAFSSVSALSAPSALSALGQCKDIQRPSLRRVLRKVAPRVRDSAAPYRVARVEPRRHDGAGPSADPGQDRDILFAVRTAIGHRLADDPRARLVLPEQLAGSRVHRLEPPFHRSLEDDIAGGGERSAPHWKTLGELPGGTLADRIPGGEFPPMSSRTSVVLDVRADERRPGDVVRLGRLEIHAQVLVRQVKQSRPW